MNKFFSILLVIAMLIGMMPAVAPTQVHAAASSTLFLKPNSEWLVDGARFAAYFFGNGEKWVSMTGPDSNGYYKVSVPSGYPSVIFCRMNGGAADNNWDNKWNQTADLTIPTSGECCWTLNSGDWGGGGSWSHMWDSGSVTTAATCTKEGVKTYTCSLCSGKKTESIAKIDHSYAAATCTKPKTCSCGATTGSALGHSWSSSTGKCTRCSTTCSHSYSSSVTKAATCTATGTRKYTCSTCKYSYTETIAKTAHSYAAATCTAPKTCTACGATSGNALGHSYSSSGSCTRCGTGCSHSYTSSVTKAATCTATGTRKYTCSTCGYSYTESIAKISHNYAAATCTAPKTCTACGTTSGSALGHSYSSSVTKAATCTTAGTRKYTCSRCSNSYTESIAATGHSYSSKVTAPTCTAQGYTTYTCSSCSDSYKDNYTDATGHSYVGSTCSGCGVTRDYYLFGFINGANYACEEDSANIGTYKFSNGTLSVTFDSDSYVAVKTGDNLSWYMTNGYDASATKVTLYNTNQGIDANKMFVPGGTTVKFTLTVNTNETLVLSYTITSCDHNYSSSVTKEATCTAAGTKTYTCSICGDSYTESIAALGHSYSGASCTTCGTTRSYYLFGFINGANYACEEDAANIGTYKFSNGTLSVTFTSDSYVAVKTGDNLSWYMTNGYDASATKVTLYNTNLGIDANKMFVPGGTTVKFTLTVNTNETLVLSYTITSCSHNYSSSVTKEATCTAAGTKTYTCSICGDSYTESIAALGHSYNSGKITTAATCTTAGVKTYTCSTCGGTKTESVAATGHSYSSKVTAATCTAQGYTTHTCANCGDSYKDTYTSALGHSYSSSGSCTRCGDGCDHSYNSGKVTTAATCTTAGVKTYTCSICGGTKTESIAATGHSYQSATCTAPKTCSTCGATSGNALGHSYSSSVTKAATCTAAGTRKYTCSACGSSYTEEIAATGHSYSSKVTAPTCTAQGYTTYTCSSCSDSYQDNYTDATGHSYVGSTCSGCGVTRDYYLFGFINGANYACEEDSANIGSYKFVNGSLTVTFESDSYVAVKTGDNLSWYMTDGYDASATTVTLYNTSKGIDANKMFVPGGTEVKFTLTVNTDETLVLSYSITSCSHNYNVDTVDATCTSAGVKTYTCSICGHSYSEEIPALGHSYVGDTCTTCGDVRDYYLFGFINGADYAYGDDGNNLGDYKFVNGKLTVTFTEDSYVGVKTGDNWTWYMASAYIDATSGTLYNTTTGASEKMRIPGGAEVVLTMTANADDTVTLSYTISSCSHNYNVDTVDATCTSAGVKTYTCSICGHSYNEDIPALGHSYSSKVTAPTCTAGGYTTYTCTVCDHSYVGDETAATGHSYSGSTCGVCGNVREYYLFGFINGANYACEEDSANIGTYKFVGGKLTVTFTSDSYVAVKTGDNLSWYMTDGYDASATTVTLYNTNKGIDANKMFVPGGTEVIFTLTVNTDETLVLSYSISSCAHNYSGVVTKEATCTSAGVKTYTCSICGNSYTESIAALGHSYSSKVTKPTCTTGGYTTYTCSVCSDSYTGDETSALGHSYVGDTCTTCGDVREYYLFGFINGADYAYGDDGNNLGDYKFVNGKLTVTFTEDSYVGVKTGDNWTWYMASAYIDATSGTLYNTTTGASEKMRIPGGAEVVLTMTANADDTVTLSYTISSCSHNYNVDTVDATCTSAGVKTYTCSICGHSYNEDIPALGHSYSSVVTAPTCTAGGYTTYTCSVCSDSYTGDETAATGHNYVNGVCGTCGEAAPVVDYYLFGYINGANYACEEDGDNIGTYKFVNGQLVATFDCDSYVAVKTGDNLNWYMTEGYDASATTVTLYNTANGIAVPEKMFVPGNVEITFTLTVNDDGTLTLSYVAAACDHSYTSAVTAPTCTAGGYTTYTCSKCGDSYIGDETAALGHSYVGGTCQHCGQAEPTVDYYLFGFINGANYACEEDGENLGIYKFANGQLVVTFTSDSYVAVKTGDNATWYMALAYDESATSAVLHSTAAGGTEKLFVPGNVEVTFTLVVNADGTVTLSYVTAGCDHRYESVVTAPTCTTSGYTTYTCTVCGHSYTGDETAALGHSYDENGICGTCGAEKPVVDYYLFGFINGANYACEEDRETIGIYKFVDGQLTVTFDSDSYIAVKTGDNANWYMTNGYDAAATTVTLYNTASGIAVPEKMFVPGGVEITLTLTVDEANDTLTLSYSLPVCEHSWTDGVCDLCGEICGHNWADGTCGICGSVCAHADHNAEGICTNCAAAVGHSYVDGVCSVCGDGCAHSWTDGVCSKCGNSCDHSWSGNSCTNCGMTRPDSVTIHFVNTLGWSGVVAYPWISVGGTTTAISGYGWPGVIVNRDAEGYYTLTLDYTPTSSESLGILFHNFNGGQTADVTISYATLEATREVWIKPSTTANSEGKFPCTVVNTESATVISPEINGTDVTFRYEGSASTVYLAGSMNGWSTSGTKLTKGSDGVWSVTVSLAPGVYEYKFIVDGEWVTDPLNNTIGGYDGNCMVVVPEDDSTVDNNTITVVLHFYRASGDYTDWDVWFWSNESSGSCAFSADPTNKGMIATFTLNGLTNGNLGYTVRKTDWSDKEFYDRFIDLSDVSSGTVHYFLNSGSASGYRVLGEDVISCAKPSYATYNYATGKVWVKTTLPFGEGWSSAFSIVNASGNASGVSVTGVNLDGNGYTLTLSRNLTLQEAGTFKVKANGHTVSIGYNAHDLFYMSEFARDYTYTGGDLGATWSKSSTTFKVWAPTALGVSVKIYDSGNYGSGNMVQYVDMKLGNSGVWYVTITGNLSGYYYNYDVKFSSYTVEATDPYAKGVGANGDRGMIVDLNSTDPSGWANDISPNKYMSYTDAIIYEMHIREMTIDSSSGVKDEWKGTYLGLTQSGTNYNGYSTALDHLKELGITHVQLMPAYDFSSVDEYHLTDWQQYAWGYDPKNFNVPEGGYSTDPFDGATRIKEFKTMVQTFHSNGINVVMDVVYNHTFDGGNYCGNKIVPNYYSRFYGEGNWSNGSGVGNDFATERAMTRNLIVNSIMHWVEEYHIDGFRFDLAGLIDTVTINDIVNTVHAKYPYVMFYGEGWAPGGTAVQYGYNLATQGNAWEVGGFGFFNDSFRNAIAGNNGGSWGFATGSYDYADAIGNYFRASNGWSTSPSQTINYVSCHDNYCLMDKIIISRNGAYWSEMVRMNNLSMALVMMAQGTPFIYSGEELLREKKDGSGNRYDNAYGTNDYINKIRWSDLETKEYAQMTDDYVGGLVEFRKNHAALRNNNGSDAWNYVSYHKISDQTILFYISGYPNYECSDGIVIIYNASTSNVDVNLNNYGIPHGYWQACVHGTQAGVNPLWGVNVNGYDGTVGVEGISTTILVLGDLIHEESVYNQNLSLVNCSHSSHTTSGLCTSCGATVDHSYSAGSCSICGLSQSAPATITVYYDNSTTNWSNVYAYAWAEAGGRTTEFTSSWPGSAMTHMGNGIYAIELPIEATTIIFNDGSGNQSANQGAPAYDSTATLYDPSTSSWITYEASCSHPSHSTEGVCSNCGLTVAHSYTDGVCGICGAECAHTWASGTCYTCGYVCPHTSHNQSGDCVLCGEAVEHTYATDGYCTNCGLACWHSWNNGTCGICGYVCGHASHTTSGMCTNCGADVTHSYTDGKCACGLAEDAPATITIYYDNSETQWENVYIYAWAEAAGRTVMYTDGWPGSAMTLVEGTVYAFTLDRNASIVIFNNGSGSQTGNLSIPSYDSGLDLYRSATGIWATYGVECEHSYVDTVTAPTCTEAGYTTHRCSLCGDSYTDSETAALGHSFVDGSCSVCGEADPAACVHSYESVVTDATCTEAGYTTHTCTLCGDSYTDSEVEALGHSYVDGACERCDAIDPAVCEHSYEDVVTEPTCTEKGFTTHTCTICGDSYTDTETEMIDHSYVDGFCEVCGAEQPAGCQHEYESVVTEPTCEEAGFTTHTCTLCGDSYTDAETEALGHNYVDGKCENCGESDYENCEHTFVDSTVSATCDSEGYLAHTCSICGYVEKENIVPALGHSYSNGVCSVCGKPKPLSTDYYLIGYINGANYGCEEDGGNLGIYKFENNVLKATFESTSYVFVKTGDNANWYMCDGYPGDGVNSANLYLTTLPIQHDKVNVPGAVEITFTLIERDDGSLTLTYVKAGACDHNYYSYVSSEPGCTTTGERTYRCSLCADTYTSTIAAKGHSYSGASCTTCGASNPYYSPTYYLFGYINGANYACEEDGANIGTYKFQGGRLTVTFDSVSYVAVKTGDNAKWYMTNGYPGDDVTSVTLYDTSTGIDANKLRVPAGAPITFYLTANSNGTLTLSYTAGACNHSYSSYVSTVPGCTTAGERVYTCSNCGDSYTETLSATGHNYVDGACAGCGDITDSYVREYYLFGWINGSNYGCEEDRANMGEYKFVDGKLVATFAQDSYIGVKVSGNLDWYMTQAYVDTTSGTFYNTNTGVGEKMFVPGGIAVYFELTVNADDTLTLSYTTSTCVHTYDEGAVTTEPTCTAKGVKTYTCTLCGMTKTEAIDMVAHSFEGDTCHVCGYVCVHSYELKIIEATCSAYADYEFTCSVCGTCQVYHAEEMADWMTTIPELMDPSYFESKTEYRYRDYEILTSYEMAIEGYTLVSSQWVTTGTNTIYYVKDWSSGFDTSNALYTQYNNIGSKVTASETETDKLVIDSDEIVGYLYFHWCYSDSYYSVENKSGSYTTFHAYYSTTAPSNFTCDTSDMSYKTSNTDCCTNSNWYFVDEVYGQTYTTSKLENTFERWTAWSEWSETEVEAIENREIESQTLYRLPNVKLGEHAYGMEITAPTCTAAGYTTHTCVNCGDSYTDSETAAMGHSYESVTTAATCTADGSIVSTCATCGDSTTEVIPATGHSYVDGICGTCGESEPATVVKPTMSITGTSLSFEDEIFYNIYYTVDDPSSIVEMGLVTFTEKLADGTHANAVDVIPGYVSGGGEYMVHTNGIPAKNMGDAVYFRIYAKLTDGSYVYGDVAGYHAVAYAKSILAKSTNANMKALVVAMVNYGAEAQLYFGYNTDSLMNSFLTAEQQALVAAYDESMIASVVSADSAKTAAFPKTTGAFKVSTSVSFDGAFSVNYYFTPGFAIDGDMTLYYWDAATYASADALTKDNATSVMTMTLAGSEYWGVVAGIAAKEIDQTIYVAAVYESNGVEYTSGVTAYSLGHYCKTQAAKETSAMKDFAAATGVYGYYAKQYFASIA